MKIFKNISSLPTTQPSGIDLSEGTVITTYLYIAKIQQSLFEGNAEAAACEVLVAALDAETILNNGFFCGADISGQQFEAGEVFLPQLMFAARALTGPMI